MQRRAARDGLTLVEFIVASALMGVTGMMLLTFLMRHTDFLETTVSQGDVRTRAQIAIDAIARELRHTTRAAAGSPPNLTIPAAPNNTRVTFYVMADQNGDGHIVDPATGDREWDTANAIQYQYVPAARQLQRVSGATTRVVASGVASAVFEDRDIDGTLAANEVRILLTLDAVTPQRRTVSTTASAIVKLRN